MAIKLVDINIPGTSVKDLTTELVISDPIVMDLAMHVVLYCMGDIRRTTSGTRPMKHT